MINDPFALAVIFVMAFTSNGVKIFSGERRASSQRTKDIFCVGGRTDGKMKTKKDG